MRATVLLAVLAAAGCGGPKEATPAAAAVKAGPRVEPAKPKAKPAPPAAKAAAEPEPGEPKAVEVAGPVTFELALAQVREAGKALEAEFEAELPKKKKLLTEDEIGRLDRVLSGAKTRATNPGSRLAGWMRQHRMDKWVSAESIKWSCADPAFRECARLVWDRSPKSRGVAALAEMAVTWGTIEVVGFENATLARGMKAVESREREIYPEERDLILRFAGEEYLANRP